MGDWERLQAILLSRHLAVPAAIAFHYLKDALDFDIPISFLEELSRGAIRCPSAIYSGLIQARPKDRMGPLGQVLRAIAKKQRKVAGIRRMPARIKDRKLLVRRVRCNRRDTPEAFVADFQLVSTDPYAFYRREMRGDYFFSRAFSGSSAPTVAIVERPVSLS